jgi:hypothetical protein
MSIAFDRPYLSSSAGATSGCTDVAPSELEIEIIIKAINIGLLWSQSEVADNNWL